MAKEVVGSSPSEISTLIGIILFNHRAEKPADFFDLLSNIILKGKIGVSEIIN